MDKIKKLNLSADEFEMKDKEEASGESVKQSYLHYVKGGDPLNRLFSFFNVKIEETTSGRIKTVPLRDKMDRWLAGFIDAGYNAVNIIETIKGIADRKAKAVKK